MNVEVNYFAQRQCLLKRLEEHVARRGLTALSHPTPSVKKSFNRPKEEDLENFGNGLKSAEYIVPQVVLG